MTHTVSYVTSLEPTSSVGGPLCGAVPWLLRVSMRSWDVPSQLVMSPFLSCGDVVQVCNVLCVRACCSLALIDGSCCRP